MNKYLHKALASLVSLKVWLIVTATTLLCKHFIAEGTWSTVVLGIALARSAMQGISTITQGNKSLTNRVKDANIID